MLFVISQKHPFKNYLFLSKYELENFHIRKFTLLYKLFAKIVLMVT